MTVLSALNGYYDRLAKKDAVPPLVPPYGYSFENIEFALVMTHDGKPIEFLPLQTNGASLARSNRMIVPQTERSSDVTPKFLWDNTSYVFGASAKSRRSDQEHTAFKEFHKRLLEDTQDEGLHALLKFLNTWDAARYVTIRGHEDALDTNIVFCLDGERKFLHQREAAKTIWLRQIEAQWGTKGICLVSGELAPIAATHPKLKGVLNAQTSGAAIVSFNEEAYTSYGKEQGANAPVSEHASFGYTTALNALLKKGRWTKDKKGKERYIYNNRVQIADATTVFWAEAPEGGDTTAEAAEQLASAFFDPPPPSDEDEGVIVRDVLQKMANGIPLQDAAPEVDRETDFYVLGLSPNAARLSIRFWHETTLGTLEERFRQHWSDLKIDGYDWKQQPPALWQLVQRISPARRNLQGRVSYDTKNAPPNLAGELMRSILVGSPYPRALLGNVVLRLRSDHVIDPLRAAIIKACLVRIRQVHDPDLPKEVFVSLNREELDSAYRLGRLFAVLERMQQAALEGVNSTIRDRFWGSASATPAAVFPYLIRNATHHAAGLRKGRGARWVKSPQKTGFWLDQEMGSILDGLGRDFPRSFTMEEQGRFAIGYFHQKWVKREDTPDDLATEPELHETNDTAEEG